MGTILRYTRIKKNWLIIAESNPDWWTYNIIIIIIIAIYIAFAIVILITNGKRRRYSPSAFPLVAITAPISSHGHPCPFVKYIYLSRMRARGTRACRCVNAYARAQERTCDERTPDSSLPLTISKCSVSMWKYAVTEERIFHFVIYRRRGAFVPLARRGPPRRGHRGPF